MTLNELYPHIWCICDDHELVETKVKLSLISEGRGDAQFDHSTPVMRNPVRLA